MRFLRSSLRVLLTLAAVVVAAVLVVALWRSYMTAPWTRDGRVQAQVVNVAPEVAGTVVEVPVRDNQFVHRGDVLFQIDPVRFRLALQQAEAAAASARNQLSFAQSESRRQQQLRVYASEEARERAENTVQVAAASLDQANASLDLAKLNLARSRVVAPVNGHVTHLRLQAGSYVSAGAAQIAIVDSDSFWIEGYFEETKLAQIKPGDPARIRLMGYDTPFAGTVDGIARGISDANDTASNRGLPSVNPVFTWVRLAQRIPVRVSIAELPPEVTLVVGTTASIAVGPESEKPAGLGGQLLDWVRDRL
jgi:RND family efflux transporter MFP subunit